MSRKHVTAKDTGAQTRNKEQEIDTLYESPHFQETPMVAQVENAGSVMMEVGEAETESDGCYWKLSADHLKFGAPSSGRRNIPDFDGLADSVDEDGLETQHFLATEERIKGEQQEKRRHRDKAHAAESAGLSGKRAERCRDEVTAGTPYQETTSDETPTHDLDKADPREEFGGTTLGKVNEAAAKLADRFENEQTVGRAVIAKQIARRVQNGKSVLDATLEVKQSLGQNQGVRQKLDEIAPYEQQEATVEVTVEQLWDPKHKSQRQVGLVSDESGERVKFTVWRAAGDKPLVYEGDTIRVERAKVNAYKGDATLAVAGCTEIRTLEDGKRGELPPRVAMQSGEHEPPAWSAESDQHAWLNDMDVEEVANADSEISDARAKAIGAWAGGRISEDEIDEYAASVAEE